MSGQPEQILRQLSVTFMHMSEYSILNHQLTSRIVTMVDKQFLQFSTLESALTLGILPHMAPHDNNEQV